MYRPIAIAVVVTTLLSLSFCMAATGKIDVAPSARQRANYVIAPDSYLPVRQLAPVY
jgi:hypothetical protein